MNNTSNKVLRLVELALLAALVVVLQFMGSFIKIGPLELSLVLVPITIGACLLGPMAGAFLGAIFGVITMIAGINGTSPFSAMLWQVNPVCFVVICLLKAILAGLGTGLIYKALNALFKEKHITLTTVLASLAAPVINTGIFVLGMFLCFSDTMAGLPAAAPDAFGQFGNAFQVVFVGLAGINFIGEFLLNLVLSPTIKRVLDIINNKIRR